MISKKCLIKVKCKIKHLRYRYTPVDVPKTIKAKRIVFDTSRTYQSQLPDFMRLDAGINFRRNHSPYSWIIMLDIQNVTNRKLFSEKGLFMKTTLLLKRMY